VRKAIYFILFIATVFVTACSSAPPEAACLGGVEVEIMTTESGVEFVRTPDACFTDLPDWPYEPQYVEIDGLRQAYVDVGSGESGETILLLHGQPSWAYLYRHMIPVLADAGHRVIAMDHVGMGRSDKPTDPDYYTYLGHTERLEAFIQELELEQENFTIFVQDWGSLIGLYVIGTHPDWFDRVVVGNGFLPEFEEGTVPFALPDNPAGCSIGPSPMRPNNRNRCTTMTAIVWNLWITTGTQSLGYGSTTPAMMNGLSRLSCWSRRRTSPSRMKKKLRMTHRFRHVFSWGVRVPSPGLSINFPE